MNVFVVSGCPDGDEERVNIKGFSNINHANKYRKKQQKDYNDYLHLKKEIRQFEDYMYHLRSQHFKKQDNIIMKLSCISNYSIAKFVDCLTYSKDVKCSVYEYLRDFKLDYVPKYHDISIEGLEIE